jgi:hypothetical protein
MVIDEVRDELIQVREEIEQGHVERALERISHAIDELDNRLLTTNQAREILGIGSVNTLKLLVKKAGLDVQFHGNRMMIPMSELLRLQNSELVRGIRTSDRLHAASANLGADGDSYVEVLEDLEASRPGSLPWSRTSSPANV